MTDVSKTTDHERQKAEVDANFAVFMAERAALMKDNWGRFAVYRAKERVAILDTLRDAVIIANLTGGFPYSIQEITERVHYART